MSVTKLECLINVGDKADRVVELSLSSELALLLAARAQQHRSIGDFVLNNSTTRIMQEFAINPEGSFLSRVPQQYQ